MIEKLDKKKICRSLPAGTTVMVAILRGTRGLAIPGVLTSWSGVSCRIDLARGSQPRLPKEGARIEIMATRLDGVYRIPGIVSEVDVKKTMGSSSPSCMLVAEVMFEQGKRLQQRTFFRITGHWQAAILVGEETDIVDESQLHPGQAWNLSAGGMLIEDRRGVLSQGMQFHIYLDLGDGAPPLGIDALVVRKDERSGGSSPRWGCKFQNLKAENEARIVRLLHEKIRARFYGKSKVRGVPDLGPAAESA